MARIHPDISTGRPEQRRDFRQAVPFALILAAGIPLSWWLGCSGFPCPRGDDAFYKSPAAELAQNGRLATPGSIGFLPQAETVFAAYPPGYQCLLGVWYLVFGVSVYSSLGFSYTVHLLGTLAVMEVARRMLRCGAEVPVFSSNVIVLAIGAVQLGNLAYFDRQEETALLWIWAEVLLMQGNYTRRKTLCSPASGLMVAMAALCSPWVGVLGAMVVVFRTLLTAAADQPQRPAAWTSAGVRLATTLATAAGVVAMWFVAMELLYPRAVADQLFGTLSLLKQTQGSGTFAEKSAVFWRTIRYNLPQLPTVVLTLVFFPALITGAGRRYASRSAWAVFLAGALGIAAVALLRPIAYTYLGAAQIMLLPCLGPAVAFATRGRSAWARLGLVLLALCALIAQRDVVRCVRSTFELPRRERLEVVFDRLRSIIPPGDLVAVRSLHWQAFQGRNPWREAYFSAILDSGEVRRCRWLVLPPHAKPDYLDGFELVEEVPSDARRYYTYAYCLWRRRDN